MRDTWQRFDPRDAQTWPTTNRLVWIFGPDTMAPVVGYYDEVKWRTYQGMTTKVTAWHPLTAPRVPMAISRDAL